MSKSLKTLLKTIVCIALVMSLGLSTPFSHLSSVITNKVKTYADDELTVTPGPDVSQSEPEATADPVELTVLEENEELREENKKYFEMSDGSMKACVYPQAVHYLKDGEYEEINNTLELVEADSDEFKAEEVSATEEEEIIEVEIITEEPIVEEEIEEVVVTVEALETNEPTDTEAPVITDEPADTEETDVSEELRVQAYSSEEEADVIDDTTVLENEEASEEIEVSVESEAAVETEVPVETTVPEEIQNPEETEQVVEDEKALISSDAPDTTVEIEITEEETEEQSEEKSDDIAKNKHDKKKNNKKDKPERKGSYYKNKSNNFTVKLPEEYGEDYTEFTDENGFVSFKLVGTNKKSLKKDDKKSMDKEDKTIARDVNDKGTYKSIKKNVDLEYDVSGNMLKETIVLNKKTKEDFVFEVKTSAASAALNEDGSITFFDENDNKLYEVSAPYMSDALGEYSKAVEVEFEVTEEGYLLTYKPDEEWLYAKDREYPVRIDPTMFKALDVENITDTYVASYQNDTYPDIWGKVDVLTVGRRTDGDIMRSMIKFDIPSAIGANDCIIDAKLYLVHYFGVYDSEIVDGIRIDVHELTEGFTEEKTYWTNRPGFDSKVIDYAIVDKDRYFPDTQIPYDSYNITELANKWHKGATNYGLLLKFHDDGGSYAEDKEVYYFAKQSVYYGDVTKYVEITYRNTLGLEDYWTYSSHSIGRAGNGYINLYNGNQVFVHEDVSNNTLINGFTLSHVYNSGLATTDSTGTNKKFYGVGWRLNLTQTLAPVSVEGNSAVKYVYTDGDGTKHYLVETDGKIVDEDGLGLTFTSISEDQLKYQLTTKDGTIMKFDQWTDLRKIIDANGNTINLNYAPIAGVDNYLTSITTSNGDTFDLSYDANYRLEYIEDKAGRTINYTYDSNNRLTKITYPGGATSSNFQYNGYNLKQVKEPGNCEINYTHTAKGRVNSIEYKGAGGSIGNQESIVYNYCQTVVTDRTGYKLTYQFDTAGRNTSVYDSEGNICASSFTAESSSSDEIFSNNKTNIETQGTVYTENLLKNGTFVDSLTNWNKNTGTFTVDTANTLLTPNTIKISNSSESYTVIHQSFSSITSGTYTLSGYVKGENIAGSGGVGVRFVINQSDGTSRVVGSEFIKEFKDAVTDNGFVKVSATVTLATGESINRIEAGLMAASGTAYIDSLQLEKGDTVGPINLIENSSFETSTGQAITPYGFSKSTYLNGVRASAATLGNSLGNGGSWGYKITGKSDYSTNAYQSRAISGSKGDAYTFGGWAKAASAESHNNTKPFALKLTFNNTDGTTTDKYIEYNTAVDDWQFLSKTVIADKNYSSMKVSMEYNRNVNTAYFDCLFLYRDTAASYVYDGNGNVISTADYATGQSSFDYSNNVLSKMVDLTGSGYEYFYDTKKNLISAKDSSGNQTIITNNSVGLPTETRLTSSDHSAAIEDGETYYIRLKGSGKYLTAEGGGTANSTNVVQAAFANAEYQKWTAEQTADGYFLFHPAHATTKSLDIVQGLDTEGTNIIIWATNTGNGQKFKVEPQLDYTYKIVPACTSTNKKVSVKTPTSQNNVTLSGASGADGYSWYFEKVEDEPATSVVSGGIYRIRAYHSGKYLDVVNSGTAIGTKVNQFQLNYGRNQQFIFTKYQDTEYYTIKPSYNTSCLLSVSSADSSIAGYKYLSIGNSTISNEKLFKLEYDESKRAYLIIPKSDETKSLDVSNYSLSNNAEIIINTKATTVNRYFVLEECSKEITSTATYDSTNSYLKTIKESRGYTVTNNYDDTKDLLTSTTDAAGNTTSYEYYDNTDRLLSVSIPNEYSTGSGTSKVVYDYNTNGSLKSITSPSGTDYGFTYDTYGRAKTTTVGSKTLGSYTYRDTYYSLVSRFDYGNGAYKTYEYDDSNRLIKESVNGSATKTYTYDKLGNIAKEYDATKSVTTTYNYDLSGRLTSLNDTSGQKLSYTYDKYNRVDNSYFKNNYGNLKTGYTYGDNDSSKRKTGLIYSISYDDEIRFSNVYDSLNRLTIRYLWADSSTSYVRYDYQNTGANKTTSLISKMNMVYYTSQDASGYTSDVYNYSYDANGNITNITSTTKNGVSQYEYTYDANNQLLFASKDSVLTRYYYDDGGNLDYVYKQGEGTIKQYSYEDANWPDLLTAYNGEAITYDNIGNPLQYRGGMDFSWESGRNLDSIYWNSGEYIGETAYYFYDADNYRRLKNFRFTNTFYSYVDGKLMTQRTGSEQMNFMYDENGIISGVKITDGTETETYYYQLNIQGDVIGILNSDGIQVATYTYDDWGKILSIEGSGADGIGKKNPIRYRGYYYDEETGFYYVSSRYYDPETGRWLNADSAISGPGGDILGYNMFTYCFNNPVNMDDPTGNWPKWAKKLAVAVAVVAVVAVVAAVTVATAGAGTAIAAVAVGAAKGAAIGLVAGAALGAAGGYLSTGTLEGTLNGMANGALSGAISGAVSGGIAGGATHATQVANADPIKSALKQLDSSGLRPGQTQISRSRVMEIVSKFDVSKANSSIYSNGVTKYIVDGHHTTVASTILGKGTCMNMGTLTSQLPSATNVYWAKKWYEIGKTVIKIID